MRYLLFVLSLLAVGAAIHAAQFNVTYAVLFNESLYSYPGVNVLAINPYTGYLYALNPQGYYQVSLSGKSVANVTICQSPSDIAVNTATNVLYVTCPQQNEVAVIYPSGSTTIIPLPWTPVSVAVNPLTGTAYVAATTSNKLAIISGTSYELFIMGSSPSIDWSPTSIAINPITNVVYVLSQGASTVTMINATSRQVLYVLHLPAPPIEAVINNRTGAVYVLTGGATYVVNGFNVVGTIPIGGSSIALDPVHNILYIVSGQSLYAVFLSMGYDTAVQIPVQNHPVSVAVNPYTQRIYLSLSSTPPGGSLDVIRYLPSTTGNYPVTIVTGSNSTWGLSLNGAPPTWFHGPNATIYLPNGIYNAYLYLPSNTTYPISIGDFVIHYSTVTITIPTYPLTVSIGPVTGFKWSIHLSNGESITTSNSSVLLYLPIGEYGYYVTFPNFTIPVVTGTVTLSGAGGIFIPTESMIFREEGLGGNFTWGLIFAGATLTGNPVGLAAVLRAGQSIIIYAPQGNYLYNATIPFGYTSSNAAGRAGPINIVKYALQLYPVTIGINSSTLTYPVTIMGSTINGSTVYINQSATGPLNLKLPNGRYSIKLGNAVEGNYLNVAAPISASERFSVWGSGVNVTVNYVLLKYPLTLSANGLSGASATITISGKDFNGTSVTRDIPIKLPNTTTIYVPDGSYTVTASQAQYGAYSNALLPSPSSTTAIVNGKPGNASFSYSTAYYNVYITVNHIGLLGTQKWSITVTGGEFNGQYLDQAFSETGPTAIISLPDGDYQYSISGSLYIITGSSGHIYINATPANITASAYSIILIAVIIAIVAAVAIVVIWRRGYLSRGGLE
jgi:DNA-binding beta-propeller fold protein YncE